MPRPAGLIRIGRTEQMQGTGWNGLIILFILLSSTQAQGDCCGSMGVLPDGSQLHDITEGKGCCPQPSLVDAQNGKRIVFDQARCCPEPSEGKWCSTYGVAGCSFCVDKCEETHGIDCVECSSISSASDSHSGVGRDLSLDYNCTVCSNENLSTIQNRLLAQREKSLVCDTSCMSGGDPDYGYFFCNYMNMPGGRVCRACCKDPLEYPGCKPCEATCDDCINDIEGKCSQDMCGHDCQALLCCATTMGWDSSCPDNFVKAVNHIADSYAVLCYHELSCESEELTCSESATSSCSASISFSDNLQPVEPGHCPVVRVSGADSLSGRFVLAGIRGGELVFQATSKANGILQKYTLAALTVDMCNGVDYSAEFGGANMDIVASHSTSGFLIYGDGTEIETEEEEVGTIACSRHVWSLRDTLSSQGYMFITVDPARHPIYISANSWIKVSKSESSMSEAFLTISCHQDKSSDDDGNGDDSDDSDRSDNEHSDDDDDDSDYSDNDGHDDDDHSNDDSGVSNAPSASPTGSPTASPTVFARVHAKAQSERK